MPFKPSSEQIRLAVEVLTEVGIVVGNGTYAKEFKSSFSSFGATVSQCGFAIALTIYENPGSDSKVRRGIPIVIKNYLIRAFGSRYNDLRSLSGWYVDNTDPFVRQTFEKDVVNAATVLKIALRLFASCDVEGWNPHVNYGEIQGINVERVDTSTNLGYRFNHSTCIPSQGSRALNLSLCVNRLIIEDLTDDFVFQRMKVSAPGLIIGGGLSHGTPDNDAVKTGLQFDYTSGLPVIPGSSVKGVIRSLFPDDDKDEPRLQYIFNILKELSVFTNITTLSEGGKDLILRLRDNMFGLAGTKGADVFADALVVGPEGISKVITDDYLTPHTGGPLDPPVPIKIVKVCSGVIFSFCYKFTDYQEGAVRITSDNKLNLCTSILEDMGIGAKTNVGYGCLKRL